MSNYWELMLMYSDKELDIGDAFKIEKELKENKELKKGFMLNRKIDEFMRVQLMLEEIGNDPELEELLVSYKAEILQSPKKSDDLKSGLSFYINGALTETNEVENQIDEAEREMFLKGIDKETNQWVATWKEELTTIGSSDKYTNEVSDYIKQGMESARMPLKLKSDNKNKRKFIYRISAAAAVLIVALGFWSLFSLKPTSAELFAEYYKPYSIIDGQTRSGIQADEKFVEIARLYKNEQYNDVGSKLEVLLKEGSSSPKILLIYGITLIEQDKYEKAISTFNVILKQSGEFSIEAKWYLALCYLKMNDKSNADKLLTELSKTPGLYKTMAENLLDEL